MHEASGDALVEAPRIDGPPTWRVVEALARLEGRKLLLHPVFLAGSLFALLGIGMFVIEAVRHPAVSWEEDGWTVSAGVGMLGLLTLVATNLATLRDHREHTEEQHRTLPAGDPARTGGLLLASLWPAVVTAVLLAAVAGYGATITSFRDHEVVLLSERVVDVAMLGAFGIALGRWIPNPFVAPLAAWGLIFTTPSEYPAVLHVLSPLTHIDSLALSTWHLVYVVGLMIVISAAALLRDTVRAKFVVAGVLGFAVVLVSAGVLLADTCPPSGRCVF